MKMIKMLGVVLSVAVLLMVGTAHADYSIVLKNEGGSTLKTYTITTNQVAHLQKKAARTGIPILQQFEIAIARLVLGARRSNESAWIMDNEADIEEQSRQ